MPRAGALLLENEPIVSAALVAASAVMESDGFRQRDVRFFIELFSNWLQSTRGASALPVHNAQVQRGIEALAKAGLARKVGRTPPRYRLGPEGLLHLLERMVHRRNLGRLDEFFLVFHVLDAYGQRLHDLLRKRRELSSQALSFDVNVLLDPEAFLSRELEVVRREQRRLRLRSSEACQTSELTKSMLRAQKPLREVVQEVERRYPYELNSQKPLGTLLAELPAAWQREELEHSAQLRAFGLWDPTRALLSSYEGILVDLSKQRRRAKRSADG